MKGTIHYRHNCQGFNYLRINCPIAQIFILKLSKHHLLDLFKYLSRWFQGIHKHASGICLQSLLMVLAAECTFKDAWFNQSWMIHRTLALADRIHSDWFCNTPSPSPNPALTFKAGAPCISTAAPSLFRPPGFPSLPPLVQHWPSAHPQ